MYDTAVYFLSDTTWQALICSHRSRNGKACQRAQFVWCYICVCSRIAFFWHISSWLEERNHADFLFKLLIKVFHRRIRSRKHKDKPYVQPTDQSNLSPVTLSYTCSCANPCQSVGNTHIHTIEACSQAVSGLYPARTICDLKWRLLTKIPEATWPSVSSKRPAAAQELCSCAYLCLNLWPASITDL